MPLQAYKSPRSRALVWVMVENSRQAYRCAKNKHKRRR